MSKKHKAILLLLGHGKTYLEIAQALKINQTNLCSTIYYMRKKGIIVKKQSPKSLSLSPMQLNVLTGYMTKEPIPDIAKRFGITCQTVMNHASAGFGRLGLTQTGIDRVAALHDHLENSKEVGTKTEKNHRVSRMLPCDHDDCPRTRCLRAMDDPFFQ